MSLRVPCPRVADEQSRIDERCNDRQAKLSRFRDAERRASCEDSRCREIGFTFACLWHRNPVSRRYRAGVDRELTNGRATWRASRRRRGRASPSIRNRGCRCQPSRSVIERSEDRAKQGTFGRKELHFRLAVTFAPLALIHNRASLGDDRANDIAAR